MNTNITIDSASVKVMRSFDYCHFEVAFSSTSANTPEQIDELRKTAARLADKAVEQYKVAKAVQEKRLSELRDRRWERSQVEEIEKKAETDRTPEEQARVKAYRDYVWASNRFDYDYQDDWRDEDEDEDDE